MRIAYATIFFILSTLGIDGQVLDMDWVKEIKPRSIGPAGMSGRVTTIDVDLNNDDRIFVGTASGGVWKSESGGVKWEPIFDDEKNISIGALAINQSNPLEIWVGTGEGNPRNSANSGKGIYKTQDGGKTWKLMGLENTKQIHRIYIHPNDPNTVLVATLGSAWGPNPERGVYKTRDGGNSWDKVLFVDDTTGAADMVWDPVNPNKIIAAMWEYGRTPWDFNSGGDGSGIYLSYDAGDTWKKVEQDKGLPKGDLGRIGLAIAPSQTNIVYALVEAKVNGFYKSTDGGENWNLVSTKDIGNRPFYYSDIFVDPKNENRIFNLYSVMSMSEDGGKTFRTIAPYNYIHPDHHAFWIHPEKPNYIIEGNDGGLNISRDGAKSWRFVSNLPVGQFYHVNVDNELPYNVYGGMQDNGTWVGPAYVWRNGGIKNSDWQELYFGDGFDAMPRRDNARYVFGMSQGGNLAYIDRETGSSIFIRPEVDDTTTLRYNWNPGMAQDPFEDCGVYYGSQFLHYTNDCGQTWETLSPDLTTDNPEKQQQHKSGGLTMDATFAENHTTIITIAPSPKNKNMIWVGTDDGNIQLTKNRGESWDNQSPKIIGLPQNAWIAQIEASQHDESEAFVVVNNYRQNDWTPYLYHTNNGGISWNRIIDENDVHGHVLCVKQDPEVPSLIFAGTDEGLFFSVDYGSNWQQWTNGYPSVPTRDMVIQEREKDLVIGTFGRAFWVLDDIQFLRDLAKDNDLTKKEFAVMSAPEAYMTSYKSYQGIRFLGDAEFEGENKGRGAMITIWNKPKEKNKEDQDKKEDVKSKKKSKEKNKEKEETQQENEIQDSTSSETKKKEKDRVVVLSEEGDTIRTFEYKAKEGFHRIRWNMSRDGIQFPGYGLLNESDFKNSGSSVLPGKYKLVVFKGENKDSTWVEIKLNPKMDLNLEDLKKKDDVVMEFYGKVEKVSETIEKLLKAKRNANNISTLTSAIEDKDLKKSIQDSTKAIVKKIDEQIHLILTPQDFKGYDGEKRLTNDLFMAFRYVNSSNPYPSQNAINSIKKADFKIEEVMNKIEGFWQKDWMGYKAYIDDQDLDLFSIK